MFCIIKRVEASTYLVNLLLDALCIYIVVRIGWALLRMWTRPKGTGARKTADTTERFDTRGKNVSDAEFEDMTEKTESSRKKDRTSHKR